VPRPKKHPTVRYDASMARGRPQRPLVLVVEDDDSTRRYVAALLAQMEYDVSTADCGEDGLQAIETGRRPAAVLLDLVLPGMSGLDVLDRIRRLPAAPPVIVVSTLAGLKTVVDAVKRGAFDYLTKPFRDEDLAQALQAAVETGDGGAEAGEPELVSASPALGRIRDLALQVAAVDAPVLVTGESGVGKEVVARLIHARSPRRSGPFVKVNCAALPNELLESELFGYEKGAFSGAHADKPGRFELAHRGSILLDEVGEMSPHLQAKLLHVLQDGEFTRLGGRRTLRSDARVLATTNLALGEAVAAGRFRADLFFRLNVVHLEVPPLRERRDDIAPLCRRFLRVYAQRYHRSARDLPPDVMRSFLAYDWPGNVRELENAVRRFLILEDLQGVLAAPSARREPVAAPAVPTPPPAGTPSLRAVAARAADEAEREVVLRVLEETRWNRKEASRRLQVSYKALLNKLKRWDVSVARGAQ
jgi:two-component system, NtrC family, response regulator AtoC